jgi:hypothetical protein
LRRINLLLNSFQADQRLLMGVFMKSRVLTCATVASAMLIAGPFLALSPATAQSVSRQITSAIDDSNRITLTGNTRPEAKIQSNDRGPVADSLSMPHMQLLLRRTPAR